MLVTMNFGIQLIVDLFSANFVDRIGYRVSILAAHICAAAGLILLTILPDLLSDSFIGILISVMIYAVAEASSRCSSVLSWSPVPQTTRNRP